MDNGGGLGPLGIRNWPYFDPALKSNLGLGLMSSVGDRERKPLLSNNSSFPADFVRDGWLNNRETSSNSNKFLHAFSSNQAYALNPPAPHSFQMIQPTDMQPKNEPVPIVDGPGDEGEAPPKKRSLGQGPKAPKFPKSKKLKKAASPKDDISRRKTGKKNEELVINGIELDLSQLPTPVCSCTGKPQQCYRWGPGGWQSACCTKNVSMYPLPLSMKRRGARIAGRKMSIGAFTKVLEKLAGEGYNLSNPIDLKTHWAKHGTNKFVTIR